MTKPVQYYYEVYDDTDYNDDGDGRNSNAESRLLGVWLDVDKAVAQAEKDPSDLGMDSVEDAYSEDLPYVVKVYRKTFGEYRAATLAMVMRKNWDREQDTDDDGDDIAGSYRWECCGRTLHEKYMVVELP